jgi:hypothetical protein
MWDVLRHLHTGGGIFFATHKPDVGHSSPHTHRMSDILRHIHTGCGIFFATHKPDVGYSSQSTYRMWDILRHPQTGCGTFFATYTPDVGYSSPHIQTPVVRPNQSTNRVIQEEWQIFWYMKGSVIVRKTVHMNMGLILNGYRDTAL